MGPPVTIRGMKEDDLRSVFLLGRELFDANRNDPWDEASLADLLGNCIEHSLVALLGKRMAGFIITEVGPGNSARIRWMAWRPGDEDAVASPLMVALLELLSSRNLASLRVAVDSNNRQLIDITKKFGFTESKHLLIMENFFPSD